MCILRKVDCGSLAQQQGAVYDDLDSCAESPVIKPSNGGLRREASRESLTKKALITGAGGQLGLELMASVPKGTACEGLTRAELDITSASAVFDAMDRIAPDIVINAAAYTAVDKAESEPEEVSRVNVLGAENLARQCASSNIRLIHISTDFVFDGKSPCPYVPESPAMPLGAYGRSKHAGEEAVMLACPQAMIIRSGWIYSALGGNFVMTMLGLMREREQLDIVSDQVGTPTWARGLAQLCWRAASAMNVNGIYHWSDAGECSWYDFAQAIYAEATTAGLLQNSVTLNPISTVDYGAVAERPAYSVLDTSMTQERFSCESVHWQQQLRNMLAGLRDSNNA